MKEFIGEKVIGCFGAMHPENEGVVDRIEGDFMIIEWDDGTADEVQYLRKERSPNGSKIGIWLLEDYLTV